MRLESRLESSHESRVNTSGIRGSGHACRFQQIEPDIDHISRSLNASFEKSLRQISRLHLHGHGPQAKYCTGAPKSLATALKEVACLPHSCRAWSVHPLTAIFVHTIHSTEIWEKDPERSLERDSQKPVGIEIMFMKIFSKINGFIPFLLNHPPPPWPHRCQTPWTFSKPVINKNYVVKTYIHQGYSTRFSQEAKNMPS